MKPTFSLMILCGLALNASADVLISQIYEGASNNKWIELVNTGDVPVPLSGYALTLWNNAKTEDWKTDGGAPNTTQDLSSYSIPANGSLLIANSQAVLPGYAIFDLTSGTTNFNGDDSVVLYNTALGAVGDTAAIVDALAFTDLGAEGADTSFYRLGNGTGFDLTAGSTVLDYPAVWGEKSIEEVDSATIADDWALKHTALFITDSLTITLSPTAVAEDAGAGVVDVTVMRSGDTASAVDVTLASSDESEAAIPTAVVQIPAGQASETFTMAIDAVDDGFVDGDQDVTISASAAGFFGGEAVLTVTDAGDTFTLVVNEVYYSPDPTSGDVNGNGTVDNNDEFIEIVNVSGSAVDLSDYRISDANRTFHTFRTGTILHPGCAVVVFGGSGVPEGTTPAFGEADVQVSTNGGLFLNDDGDTVTIFDENDSVVFAMALPDVSGTPEAGSLNLVVELDGASGYERHATLAGDPAKQFSPGTLRSGAPHCDVTETLTLELSPASIGEDGDAGAVTATVTLSSAVPAGLPLGGQIFSFYSGDTTELVVDPLGGNEVFILEGMTTGSVTLDPVNDTDVDGTQSVTVTVVGSGYLNGTAAIDVTDDGDVELEGDLFFSEYAEGSGNNKYLEIYNPTAVTISLDGYAFPSVSNAPDNGVGNYDFWNPFESGKTIAPGDVYIIAHPSADQTILDLADQTFTFLSNGDDGFALVKGSEGSFVVIDWIGDWNGDPGDGWEVAGVPDATKDHVLVRKNSVSEGNPDWDAARGTGESDSEWIVKENEDWSSLGTHPNAETGGDGLLITDTAFNAVAGEVVLTIAGLDAADGIYALEHSTDLNQADAWEIVGGVFFVGQPNVVETAAGSGIYSVTISDAELATEAANYYRVTGQ